MRDNYFSLRDFLGAALGALLLSHAALAPAQTLYRVELMVFAYPSGGASEQWEAIPELSYPDGARFLADPREQSNTPPNAQSAGSGPAGGPGLSAAPASEAYVLLPANERELGARAESMRSSGRYRILFHESWLQPMATQSAALPIILERSGGSETWPELQGTITLYQAGDNILATNLWLNTRGEYLPGTWRMPPPPRAPGIADTMQPVAHLDTAGADIPGGILAIEGAGDYPYRHAVLLQQSRRMRDGALTYIDHPMLGVVAKISSLEEPVTSPAAAEVTQQSSPVP